jgi:methylmalonyl-CoA/ethylmalonyl-CoA epimerase
MIVGVDHIGLATTDPLRVGEFLGALGLSRIDGGTADDYGVACEFWRGPDPCVGTDIEIVSPARDGSAIDSRLTGQGAGLYHVAFVVDDVRVELRRLRGLGLSPVDAEPCRGARPGMKVAFMYVPRPASFLVELVEYGPSKPENSV